MRSHKSLTRLTWTAITAALLSVLVVSYALASHAVGGADVKVTNDNNNVDGGTPNPGFDASKPPGQ